MLVVVWVAIREKGATFVEKTFGGKTKTSRHHKSRLIINPFAFTFLMIYIDFASIKTHNRHQSHINQYYTYFIWTIWSSTRRNETIQLHYTKKPSNQTVSYLISAWNEEIGHWHNHNKDDKFPRAMVIKYSYIYLSATKVHSGYTVHNHHWQHYLNICF